MSGLRPARGPAPIAVAFLLAAAVAAPSGTVAQPVRQAAVASAAPAATEAGAEPLRAGGNAVDAAVATALALAVVHPRAGNLGGGGFAVARVGGVVSTLDFRETAPAAATHDMYLGADGMAVAERSTVGPLAAGVPGSPTGLYELHRRLGRLPWPRVVAPAVRLARDGFVVTPALHDDLAEDRELLARFPETAAVWLPAGEPPPVGSTMRLPRLAALLDRYGKRGPEAITRGRAARAIERASRRHGGVLTAADLAAYRPVWREPLRFEAFGWQVASMDLPSSGGVILEQTCALAERLGLAAEPAGSPARLHLLAEIWRRAFADRFLLGDPVGSAATAAELLSAEWLDRRAASVDRAAATPSSEVRPWPGVAPEGPADTTHLSVLDADGNLVALTTTINTGFGCGLLVPELEILLNNEMDDFAVAPGRPNVFGLVQGEANAVVPGRRMLSSMTPTVAWRGDERLAVGAAGGPRIVTATAQVLLGVALDGRALAEATAAPRVHHQWLPDRLLVEPVVDRSVVGALERLGHRVEAREQIAEVHAVARRAGGTVEAAADPRAGGTGVVVGGPAQR
jgi:gamma-glutamyltranspeptidase/glutathione hydrolase